jgi:hypothetical protein
MFTEEPLAKLEACAIQSKRRLVRRPLWRGEARLIRVRESISVGIYLVHLVGALAYIRFMSLFLATLVKGITEGTFSHQTMEGGVPIAPLPCSYRR